MMETDAMIGGEESGGYAFKGNVPERDGILAGLYFLDHDGPITPKTIRTAQNII